MPGHPVHGIAPFRNVLEFVMVILTPFRRARIRHAVIADYTLEMEHRELVLEALNVLPNGTQLPRDLEDRDITDEGISSDHIVAIANDYYYGDI